MIFQPEWCLYAFKFNHVELIYLYRFRQHMDADWHIQKEAIIQSPLDYIDIFKNVWWFQMTMFSFIVFKKLYKIIWFQIGLYEISCDTDQIAL